MYNQLGPPRPRQNLHGFIHTQAIQVSLDEIHTQAIQVSLDEEIFGHEPCAGTVVTELDEVGEINSCANNSTG